MNLTGKVAIVTGASSGIGQATVEALAAEGVKVALVARRQERLEALKEKLAASGGQAAVFVADVTDRPAMKTMAQQVKDRLGGLDILINNAGLMPLSFMKNLHEDEWERMVDVNIKGVLNGVGAVLPAMIEQKSGHIVTISSVSGRRVFPGGAVYCATKFAVRALSEGLRLELTAAHNIRVTVIEPGSVTTELGSSITDPDILQGADAYFANLIPLNPADIARSIIYALTQPAGVNVVELMVMPTTEP